MHEIGDVGVRHGSLRGFRRPSGTRIDLAGRPGVETPGYYQTSLRDDSASTFSDDEKAEATGSVRTGTRHGRRDAARSRRDR